jgi:hypothetical protein
MRRFLQVITVLLMGAAGLAGSGQGVFGQDIRGTAPILKTDHYEIYAVNLDNDPAAPDQIQQLATDLGGRFAVYNRLFRFNPGRAAFPLTVRLIPGAEAYGTYVAGRLGEQRAGAVYLHYNQAERRELVINYDSSGPRNRALPYQAFIQYLRAFIPNPPSWIQEGFAIYFSTLDISAAGEIGYMENLSWLERVKTMAIPPVENILLANADRREDADLRKDANGAADTARIPPADLPALSWSLVSFFLNSGNEDYFRSLLESFMLFSPDAYAEENSRAAAERIEQWNGFENLDRDYRAYLASRKTFTELMEDGRNAYGAGDLTAATFAFTDALEQRPNHYAPYYYLGLIYYGNGSWYWAEQYYNRSIELGADKALVLYALGLNAASEGLAEKAAGFLRGAAEADPARYAAKAEALLKRLGN